MSRSLILGSKRRGKSSVVVIPESISIALSSAARTVTQGSTTTLTVTLTRAGGYAGTVTPAVSGLPTGVTGAWSDSSMTGADATTVLTLTATGVAPLVTADAFTITLSGAGVTDATANATVTVQVAGAGWNGTGLPTGDHILYAHDFSGGALTSTAYSGSVTGTGANGGASQAVEADATARSGYAMKCNWSDKGGANINQAVFYEYSFSAADIAKITAAGGVLHQAMRFKLGTSAYSNDNVQKIFRPKWTRSISPASTFQCTLDAQYGHWISAGTEIVPDQSNMWAPDGTSSQSAAQTLAAAPYKPSTIQNTYRYLEWRVEVGTSGQFKAKLWVDGNVAFDTTKTGLTPATFTAFAAYFWDTYNNSNEARTDTTDFIAIATDYIGVPA